VQRMLLIVKIYSDITVLKCSCRLKWNSLVQYVTWTFQARHVLRKQLSPFTTQNCFSKSIANFVLVFVDLLSNIPLGTTSEPNRRHFFFNFKTATLLNELWNFTVDTHAYCTHFIIDRSINVWLRTGCRTWRFVDRHVTRFWPIGKQKNWT
jgi:hypothetical protein